jgi:hypothetical protein
MTEQQLDVRGLIKSNLKRIVSMLTQLLVFALFVPLCLGEKNSVSHGVTKARREIRARRKWNGNSIYRGLVNAEYGVVFDSPNDLCRP